MTFDIPYDYDALRAAVALALKSLRYSFTYRYDDLTPGWCEWELVDALSQARLGHIRIRRHGSVSRMSLDLPAEAHNILVPYLQSMNVPLRPKEQALYLGKSDTPAEADPGETPDSEPIRGHGLFEDADHFMAVVGQAVRAVRALGKNPSQDKVRAYLACTPITFPDSSKRIFGDIDKSQLSRGAKSWYGGWNPFLKATKDRS